MTSSLSLKTATTTRGMIAGGIMQATTNWREGGNSARKSTRCSRTMAVGSNCLFQERSGNLPEMGLDKLVVAPLPSTIKPTDHDRVLAAIDLFRKRDASNHDRRNAVRMLADVLEPLRNQLNKVITAKDESDLFPHRKRVWNLSQQ